MNPFKSWPVFAAAVYATVLTAPSWWGERYVYGPNWIIALSWLVAPWMWVPDGAAGRPWKIALVASWAALGALVVFSGASGGGVFLASSLVMLGYVVLGTRKLWKT